MKIFRWVGAGVLATVLTLPSVVLAHLAPGPPYIQINGNYVDASVATTPSSVVDVSNSGLTAGEVARFRVDESRIAESAGFVPFAIQWRWGDGSQTEGYEASHIYQKPGTYQVEVLANKGLFGSFRTIDRLKVTVDSKSSPLLAIAASMLFGVFLAFILWRLRRGR